MLRTRRVKTDGQTPIQVARVFTQNWPVHVVRDGTIAVEQAADQIQEQLGRYLNSPERQALSLRETGS